MKLTFFFLARKEEEKKLEEGKKINTKGKKGRF